MHALTGSCCPFSPRRHDPHAVEQAFALRDIYMALDRVRLARPKVVLIENVAHPEVVDPISEVVTRIAGYHWRGAILEPSVHAGFPVARKRFYWIGVRRD